MYRLLSSLNSEGDKPSRYRPTGSQLGSTRQVFSSDNGSILTISMNKIMYYENAPGLGMVMHTYDLALGAETVGYSEPQASLGSQAKLSQKAVK